MDTADKTGYEWVQRGCIKTGGTCTSGDTEVEWPDTEWVKKLGFSNTFTATVRK